jgi:uncharacterized protein YndB with AHSA1/START domain
MTQTQDIHVSSVAEREIAITRIFDAPPEVLWKVWTEPDHIARWWGPKGFTNTIHVMDVKPGGSWKFVMHGPDGVNYPNKVTYLEVKWPELLVYDHGDEGELTHFRVTVTFEGLGQRTRLSMQMLFKTADQRDKVAEKFHAVEGLRENMDKLEVYLTTL